MKIRDRYGYAVTRYAKSPITNFLRYLIHGNIRKTWELRNRKRADAYDREESGDILEEKYRDSVEAVMRAEDKFTPATTIHGVDIPAGPYSYTAQKTRNNSVFVRFHYTGSLTLVHEPKIMHLPGGLNIEAVAGDTADFIIGNDGLWVCMMFQHVEPKIGFAHGRMSGGATPQIQQIAKDRPSEFKTYTNPRTFSVTYDRDQTIVHDQFTRLPDGANMEIKAGDRAVFQRLDNGACLLTEFYPYNAPIHFGDVKTFLDINKGVLE